VTKTELEERLDERNFQPFRINTSDGKHYDVTNPRLVVAMDTRLFIALPENHWALIALRHVTSLEDAQAA
jgi:hypothetical protein